MEMESRFGLCSRCSCHAYLEGEAPFSCAAITTPSALVCECFSKLFKHVQWPKQKSNGEVRGDKKGQTYKRFVDCAQVLHVLRDTHNL
eukprot:1841206-Amphidinium_carterae.1